MAVQLQIVIFNSMFAEASLQTCFMYVQNANELNSYTFTLIREQLHGDNTVPIVLIYPEG